MKSGVGKGSKSSGKDPSIIRPDNFMTRSAELHSEIAVGIVRGEGIAWTGLEVYPDHHDPAKQDPQKHLERALELRIKILE